MNIRIQDDLIMEKELRILKTISVGLQGRIYDHVYYIVDGKQRSRAYARPNDPETGAQRPAGSAWRPW